MEPSVADAMKRQRQPEEMLPLLKRHEVQVLRRAGLSAADVAKRTGVSLRQVRRLDKETPPSDADDARERKARRIGRPSKAEPFRAFARPRPRQGDRRPHPRTRPHRCPRRPLGSHAPPAARRARPRRARRGVTRPSGGPRRRARKRRPSTAHRCQSFRKTRGRFSGTYS